MPFEIIKPDTHIYNFVGQAKWALAVSGAILLLAAGSLGVRGIRFGLDFTGGIDVQVQFPEGAGADEASIREVLGGLGLADAADVVRFGETGSREFGVRMHRETAGEQGELVDALRKALAEKFGGAEIQRVEFVGPKVGAELRRDGLLALAIASLLLLVYIGFRFTPIFAPGAILAQIHDILVTAGLLVLLGREFDLTVLAALLAILGYSINDKIVIYDRIRENMALHTTFDFPHMVNDSLNQTLSRTVLTGGTAIFASFALFLWGGPVIETFGLAMGLGIIVGTYSSLYITTPILLALHARYGKKQAPAAGASKKAKPARV